MKTKQSHQGTAVTLQWILYAIEYGLGVLLWTLCCRKKEVTVVL